MTTSEGILKWLAENKDWFKPTSIATKLKIDKGNFSRYIKSEIPEKYLTPIMELITPLGFNLDEPENSIPELIGTKGKKTVKVTIPAKEHNINEPKEANEIELRIAKIEELLSAPPKYLPSYKRTPLENELSNLKFKLNKI